ncbi:hypothetical protein JCM19294_2006 [Nonlabens tegetincola]|uniref:Uncharacterized protein n=1 Tax=Nonlabens tegetincola TaxID=323273 RepID=A0A090Q456_9FLAO|nr:hypothetical protein [Nonlabens tegetincola]GAK96493.1 hypothetical protein JCM19294_2006 [Nonlabens tegetincola]
MIKKNQHNGFNIPDGYFDNLEFKLHKIAEDTDRKQSMHGGFQAPEDYWEQLDKKLMNQPLPINDESKRSKVISLLTPLLAVAATIAVLLYLFPTTNEPSDELVTTDGLTGTELADYLAPDDILSSDYQWAEILTDDFIEQVEVNVQDDDLHEYLNDVELQELFIE